jgi:NADPH:quinone reductase-like Zn-dependent oxidoreductase
VKRFLLNGAGGSIGTFGVQIAKAMGAEVTAFDCTIKEGMLRRIGADHFIDYTKEDFTKFGQTLTSFSAWLQKVPILNALKHSSPRAAI